MPNNRQIFISYSHKDAKWLKRLKPFLQPLVRDEELKIWSDTDIKPSSDWHASIQKALSEANAAILLISQDFIASDYIKNNELPQLLNAASDRGLRIFPVFVSSSYLTKDSPLLIYQGVNSPSSPLDMMDRAKQNEIFVKLVKSIDDLFTASLVGITEDWLEKFRSRFVPITGDTFIIGDNDPIVQPHALKEHLVQVDSFRLGQYVVTQSEWIALMNTQPWLNKKNVRYGNDNPAVKVQWHDAMDFIRRINKVDSQFSYRLPTEAEWEYAARGGQELVHGPRTKFSFSDDKYQLEEYGWYAGNASNRGDAYAHPVGLLKENPLKLFDMHGNIWEWTSTSADDETRVVRGGGFNAAAIAASSAYRLEFKPEVEGEALGFRLVQEPK